MDQVKREALRYLGYGKNTADCAALNLIDSCMEEVQKGADPKHIYREYPLRFLEDGTLDLGAFQTKSKHLFKNLQDCCQVILFAATLGTGIDVLLHRYTRLEMSRAVVMQGWAAAWIEDYCDRINENMKKEYEAKGLYLRPRFSPGYGDFSLECQKPLTAALETGKRIGITLTDSLLMVPSKSVTAVMGVSEKPYRCEVKGCEACEMKNCVYRRG